MATTKEVLEALTSGNPGKGLQELFAGGGAPAAPMGVPPAMGPPPTLDIEGILQALQPQMGGTALRPGGFPAMIPERRMAPGPRGTIETLETELQTELAEELFQREGAEAALRNQMNLFGMGMPRRDFFGEMARNALLPSASPMAAAGAGAALPGSNVVIPTGPTPRSADFIAEEPVPGDLDYLDRVREMFEETRPEAPEERGFMQNALMALALGAGGAQGDTLGKVLAGFGGGVGQAAFGLIQEEERLEREHKQDLREFLRDRAAIELDVAQARDERTREQEMVRFRNEQTRLNAQFEDLKNQKTKVDVASNGMIVIERDGEVEIQVRPEIIGHLNMLKGLGSKRGTGKKGDKDVRESRARDLFPDASIEAQTTMDGLFDLSSLMAQDVVPDSPAGEAFASITGVTLDEMRNTAVAQANTMGFTGSDLGPQVVALLENQIFLALASAARRDPALLDQLINTLR